MRTAPALLAAFGALTLFSCAGERGDTQEPAEAPEGFPAPSIRASAAPPAPAPAPRDRQVVRNAELSLVVADPPAAAERLVRLADSLGGYASDLQADRRDQSMHYRIVLRVPGARLDEALGAARALAIEIRREAIRTEDVTDQVVDLEARLVTLRATEEELRALLAESRSRGSGAEEIMAVHRELTEIRTRIEQTQGQLETLESRVALSTATIELWPEAGAGPLVGEGWRPGSTVRSAVRVLVDMLQGLADFAIYAAIVLVPILALLALPILVLVRLLRRRDRRRAA